MTVKVIIDSNFLFVQSEFRVDVLEELESLLGQLVEPILLSPTYQEIRKISEEGSPKIRQQASLALRLAEKCRIVEVEKDFEETCDDLIVRVAGEWRSPVATNDRTLRRRLRNINVPVIYLRQKSRLEMEGSLP
ncbi:MAG: PIN domain-containing protein [Candidatus Bathyarchaeia archaeon]